MNGSLPASVYKLDELRHATLQMPVKKATYQFLKLIPH